jgi:hypothetical protein
LVLTALGLMVLMLMAGLGVDVAYLRYQKQQMQKAADAGAIAAASALVYGGDWNTAGLNDAKANGFTDGDNGISVKVYSPPQTQGDPFTGKADYVEVIVSQAQPTFFMRVGGFDSVDVRSRAIASAAANPFGCIFVMDPSDGKTLLIDGNVNVNAACGIQVLSDNSDALHKNGNSGNISASGIGVVGGFSGSGFSPAPVTGIAPFNDPLSTVNPPAVNGCDVTNLPTINGNASLTPKTYCGGITIHGTGTVTFAPGTYVLLGGGLTVTGSPTLLGDGVTFYDTADAGHPYGPINLTGSSSSVLTAPSSGPLQGILLFQDRSINPKNNPPVNSVDGSGGATFTGALYFPTTTLQYKGTPDLTAQSIIVAWKLDIRGDVSINDTFPDGAQPVRSAVLVE